jgi:hypothetical protein
MKIIRLTDDYIASYVGDDATQDLVLRGAFKVEYYNEIGDYYFCEPLSYDVSDFSLFQILKSNTIDITPVEEVLLHH